MRSISPVSASVAGVACVAIAAVVFSSGAGGQVTLATPQPIYTPSVDWPPPANTIVNLVVEQIPQNAWTTIYTVPPDRWFVLTEAFADGSAATQIPSFGELFGGTTTLKVRPWAYVPHHNVYTTTQPIRWCNEFRTDTGVVFQPGSQVQVMHTGPGFAVVAMNGYVVPL
ncbi:MAG: hypothetical protein IPM29_23420 [Planctomycetes bacterium]|nr:hypothetical protein [Planctomycetota bacterium]